MAKKIHTYGRKALSLLLTLVMLTSMLQLTAFAATGDGSEGNPWQIGDTVIDDTEPTGAKVEGSKWVSTAVDATYKTEPSCGKTEHAAHVEACYSKSCTADEHTHSALGEADGCRELICAIPEHAHSGKTGSCYTRTCGKEAHKHNGWVLTGGCYSMVEDGPQCGKEEHEHTDACYTLTCTTTEHTHSAESQCYEVCQLTEHTHSDVTGACYTLECDNEIHSHSIEGGCYEVDVPAHTLWTLEAMTYGAKVTVKVGSSAKSGATVVVVDSEGNVVATATTQKVGSNRYASFSDLPAGTYTVEASYKDDEENYSGTGTLVVDDETNEVTITLSSVNTASHFDIHIGLTAKYTDTYTNKTYETAVQLSKQDYLQGRLKITADSSLMYVDADSEDDISSDSTDSNQMRFYGYFPVGTYADPVKYTIRLTKDVTFTLDGGKTITIPMTFERTGLHYWHEGNVCESIHNPLYGSSHTSEWKEGDFVGGGMDFKLGASESSGSSAPTTATLTIQKNVTVNGAAPTSDMTFVFGVYDADNQKIDDVDVTVAAGDTVAMGTTVLDLNTSYYVKENTPPSISKHTATTTSTVPGGTAKEGLQSDTFSFTDDANVLFVNTYTKDYEPGHELGSITVQKTSNGGETPANTTFTLQKKDGSNWVDVESVKYSAFTSGSYVFDDLAEGDYKVVEDEASAQIPDCTLTVTNNKKEIRLDKEPVGNKGDTKVTSATVSITNAYAPKKGSLTIVKNVSGLNGTAAMPAGTSFTVTGDGYSRTILYSDFEGGRYIINGLNPGSYTVTEDLTTANVAGYTRTGGTATGTVSVSAGGSATVTLSNVYQAHSGRLTIVKNATAGVTVPAGTTFNITGPNGYTSSVTYGNFNGGTSHTIENLAPGSYTVTEVTATADTVDGYNLNATTTVYTGSAEVVNGANATVTITNNYDRELGNLKFKKTVSGLPQNLSMADGVAFTITGPSGFQPVTIYYSNLDANGEYLLRGVPTGNYTVTEDTDAAQVSGYSLNVTGGTATVTEGNTATATLTNTYTQKVGSVTITKTVTGATQMMPDTAVFQLKQGDTVVRSITWAEMKATGTHTFSNIPVGDYVLVEVGATNATIEQTHILTVEITGTEGANDPTVKVTNGSTANAYITNDYEERDGALTIIKEASGLTGTAVVPGTTAFAVKNASGATVATVYYSSFTANADGKMFAIVNGLDSGTYTVVEDTASAAVAGHDLTGTTYSGSATIAPNGSGTITVTNTYAVHTGSVTITKTATGLPSGVQIPAGTTFQLKQVGATDPIATATYSQFEDGRYTFENVPIGNYTVVELRDTAEVNGYDLTVNADNAPVSVTVTKDTDSPAAFVNHYLEDAGTLKIVKTAEGLTVPAAATFTVTGPNGYDETFRYDQFVSGTLTISGLVPGQYTVVENESTAVSDVKYGLTVTYNNDATLEAGTAAVVDDGEATVTIHNSYAVKKGSLTINKTIVGDDMMPDTTVFQLKHGDDVIKEATWAKFTQSADGKTGSITFDNITVGSYTLVEIGATNDTIKESHSWTVTGLENSITIAEGANSVTVVNTYEKGIFNYDVVHAYYVSENGGSYKPVLDAKGEPMKSAPVEHGPVKIAPQNETVFNAEASSDTYTDGYTYERKSTYAEEEVTRVGTLKEENLVYTVKYYRSNWTVGSLEIAKTIKGLDSKSEKKLAENLTFTVTGPDDYSETFTYGEDFEDGKLVLKNLVPGTYTVTEDTASAEVASYDLTVTAGGSKGSSTKVEVKAQLSPAKVSIVNQYVGRIYTIWFDGGDHGSVKNVNGLTFDGVYRSMWWEYKPVAKVTQEGSYDWANLNLSAGQHAYYSANGDIYPNLVEYPMVQEDTELVMFTFTGADWAEHSKDMYIGNPGLEVDEGYTSDGKFYIPGTEIAFTTIADAVAYMDENVEPDANGIYNVTYRAVYDENSDGGDKTPDGGDKEPEDDKTPGGGGGNGGGGSPLPPVIIPDVDTPKTDLPDLPDEEVPLADLPDEEVPLVDLPEEDVPLTGDASGLYVAMAAISGMGLIYLAATGKKREEEEAAE